MSTTTMRLPEDPKACVAVAAKRGGTSTRGSILEAIAEKVRREDQDELRADFDAVAEERYAGIVSFRGNDSVGGDSWLSGGASRR
ncbi:MAG: hypothetical protein WA056_01810 [Gallionella sp.]